MENAEDPHHLTFIGALAEIASGTPDLVIEEIYRARIATCLACSERAPINVCRVCKCIIPLKAKFVRSSCPQNRWKQ